MSALTGMPNVTVVTENDYLLNINSHIYHTAKPHPPACVDKCNLLAVTLNPCFLVSKLLLHISRG